MDDDAPSRHQVSHLPHCLPSSPTTNQWDSLSLNEHMPDASPARPNADDPGPSAHAGGLSTESTDTPNLFEKRLGSLAARSTPKRARSNPCTASSPEANLSQSTTLSSLNALQRPKTPSRARLSLGTPRRTFAPSTPANDVPQAVVDSDDECANPIEQFAMGRSSDTNSRLASGAARASYRSRISRLRQEDAEMVRAGQALGNVRSVAKELLENALDAGATHVEVSLRGKGGLDSVSVSDNGCGVTPADFLDLCTASATSKKDCGSTFGFRGTALASVCATCSRVKVVSRCRQPNAKAFALEYSTRGVLVGKKTAARNPGTSIEANGIFRNLPVRRKAAMDQAQREVAKVVGMVQSYALVSTATRIELRVDGASKLLYVPLTSTSKSKSLNETPVAPGALDLTSLRHAVTGVLGHHVLKNLVDFSCSGLGPEKGPLVNVTGLVSSGDGGSAKGIGRGSTSSSQFVYLNRRPVDMARLVRAVNESYRRAMGNPGARPSFILNLSIDPKSVDVNLAPDKRAVLCEGEPAIVEAIAGELEKLWAPTVQNTLPQSHDIGSMFRANARSTESRNLEATQNHSENGRMEMHLDVSQPHPDDSDGVVQDDGEQDNDDDASIRLASSRNDESSEGRPSKRPRTELIDGLNENRGLVGGVNDELEKYFDSRDRTSSDETEDISEDEADIAEVDRNSDHPGPEGILDGDEMMEIVNSFQDSVYKGGGRHGGVTAPPPSHQVSADLQRLRDEGIVRKTTKGNYQRSPKRWTRVLDPEKEVLEPEEQIASQSLGNTPLSGMFSRRRRNDHVVRPRVTPSVARKPLVFAEVPGSSWSPTDLRPADIPIPDHPALAPTAQNMPRPSTSRPPVANRLFTPRHRPSTTREVVDVPVNKRRAPTVVSIDWNAILDDQSAGGQETRADVSTGTMDLANSAVGFSGVSGIPDLNSNQESIEQTVAATAEMKKLFRKEWFEELEILGQFNLGFILCRLRQELFIVDQHAADEKRNFEEIKAKLPPTQELVKPLPLRLTAEEELLVLEHQHNFAAGGYRIECKPERPPTRRLFLMSQPASRRGGASFYVMDDIADMVSTIKTNPPRVEEPLRPARNRMIIASQACRRSVMVGDPLQINAMRKIVRALSQLEHPWTCPHGRPTIRHLYTIPSLGSALDGISQYEIVDSQATILENVTGN